MKKMFLIFLFILLVFTGCNNKEEDEKSVYLGVKSKLLEQKKFTSNEELTCDIIVNIDRIDDEKIVFEVSLSNPKENMHDIKAMLVHNYFTEDVFPTIGFFNKSKDLLVNTEDSVILSGNIKTDTDIDNLNLKLKLLVEYIDDFGNKKDIYYITTK